MLVIQRNKKQKCGRDYVYKIEAIVECNNRQEYDKIVAQYGYEKYHFYFI